jgi:amidohydrolase
MSPEGVDIFMLEQARALADQISAWRRDFHQHPELGFQEVRTAGIVAQTLGDLGLEVQTGVAKTGVVGYLGEGSPVVAIRADMDALPILEATGLPFSSQNSGVMHACGHDAHSAILLAVATLLTHMPDRPAGQVRFLFQPSEEMSDAENKSGGLRMTEEGAMEGVDVVIALHVASDLPANQIMVETGFATAAADAFQAVIKGTGGHGAYPHQGIDPTFLLAQVLNAIHGIRARRINPVKAAVISIGSIHAGKADNVIPEKVDITGTMRSFDDETRELLRRELETALGVARALGGDYKLELFPGYPSTINHPEVVTMIKDVATDAMGKGVLLEPTAGMGAEDFSYMTRAAPGAMFMLGAAPASGIRLHHTPQFDLDEASFPTGAAILAETTVRLLRRLAVEKL